MPRGNKINKTNTQSMDKVHDGLLLEVRPAPVSDVMVQIPPEPTIAAAVRESDREETSNSPVLVKFYEYTGESFPMETRSRKPGNQRRRKKAKKSSSQANWQLQFESLNETYEDYAEEYGPLPHQDKGKDISGPSFSGNFPAMERTTKGPQSDQIQKESTDGKICETTEEPMKPQAVVKKNTPWADLFKPKPVRESEQTAVKEPEGADKDQKPEPAHTPSPPTPGSVKPDPLNNESVTPRQSTITPVEPAAPIGAKKKRSSKTKTLPALPVLGKPAPEKEAHPREASSPPTSESNAPVGLPAAVAPTEARSLQPGLIPYNLYSPHDPCPALKPALIKTVEDQKFAKNNNIVDDKRTGPLIPEKEAHPRKASGQPTSESKVPVGLFPNTLWTDLFKQSEQTAALKVSDITATTSAEEKKAESAATSSQPAPSPGTLAPRPPLPPLRQPMTPAPGIKPQPRRTSRQPASDSNAPVAQTKTGTLKPGLIPYNLYSQHEQSANLCQAPKTQLANADQESAHSKTAAEGKRRSPTEGLIVRPQLQFHQTLAAQDDEMSALRQQNNELLNQVETLINQVKQSNAKHSLASQKRQDLGREIEEEKIRRNLAESGFVQLQDESRKVKTQLVQARAQLREEERDSEKKTARITEVEELKDRLKHQRVAAEKETAALYADMQKQNNLYADVSSRARQLEAALTAERTRTVRAETRLAQQVEQTSALKASLARVQQDFKEQQRQWEQEEHRLSAEQKEAEGITKTALMERRGHLEEQRQQWEHEKSSLLQMISTTTETLAEKEADEQCSTAKLMERIKDLEQQMTTISEEQPRKSSSKKKSRKKRSK